MVFDKFDGNNEITSGTIAIGSDSNIGILDDLFDKNNAICDLNRE